MGGDGSQQISITSLTLTLPLVQHHHKLDLLLNPGHLRQLRRKLRLQ